MMRLGHTLIWFTLALFISITPGIGGAADDIRWPEAVGRLAGAKSKAETCAAVLNGHGDKQQISRGQLAYGEAKAKFDAVNARLITALPEGGAPQSLPRLETDLNDGAAGLGEFCQSAHDLLPITQGRKDGFADIAKGAIQPVIDALSEGVAALYNNHRKDDALTIETIKTQLEAAKWPNFAEVKAAK
jgi:hypothetical protein